MQLKVTEQLNQVIKYAREEAMRTGSYGIGPDHLFLGIIRQEDNAAFTTLQSLGIEPADVKAFIDQRIFTGETIPYEEMDHINFSRQAQNVLSITVMEAARLKSGAAAPQHLLLALCRTTESYGQVYLRSHGVDYGRLLALMEDEGLLRPQKGPEEEAPKQPSQGPEEAPEEEKKLDIEEFAYDLTKAAREGKLDPVVGRDTEIARVIEILGRRKKNNPMLIGEPGVGKSAIVEGIAQRIAAGAISPALAKKRILSLDIAAVVAGTKYRGDFEKRLKGIIKEASENPDLILFIDEFHTIVGAGGASGSLDAANMLKPALARGEFQCIGATTLDEFTKIVEKDGALDRRFQKIVVEATGVAESITILQQLKPKYEEFHGVNYTRRSRRPPHRPLYHRQIPPGQGHRRPGRGGKHGPSGYRPEKRPRKRGGGRRRSLRGVQDDGHSGEQGGRKRRKPPGEDACPAAAADYRPERGHREGGARHPAQPGGPQRPEPSHRHLPFLWADGGWKNAAGPFPGRVPF